MSAVTSFNSESTDQRFGLRRSVRLTGPLKLDSGAALTPVDIAYETHDALMAVAHNAIVSDDTRFRLTPDHYLKSRADMAKLFANLPEALENTVEIARRCHCGQRATQILRYDPEGQAIKSGNVVEVGGDDRYVSVQ